MKTKEESKQEYFDENPTYCQMCDGSDHTVLGVLGKRVHLRCISCGWEFSRIIPDEIKID
jgi:hypothetical protein